MMKKLVMKISRQGEELGERITLRQWEDATPEQTHPLVFSTDGEISPPPPHGWICLDEDFNEVTHWVTAHRLEAYAIRYACDKGIMKEQKEVQKWAFRERRQYSLDVLSSALGLEDNSLRNSRTPICYMGDRRESESDKQKSYLAVAEFIGFMDAVANGKKEGSDKPLYPALNAINERARSGWGHNSPKTGKFVHEYYAVSHRMNNGAKSPGALERKVWAVKEAALRKHGCRVSFELALEAIGVVGMHAVSKGATVATAMAAGYRPRSYREGREIIIKMILGGFSPKNITPNMEAYVQRLQIIPTELADIYPAIKALRGRGFQAEEILFWEKDEIVKTSYLDGTGKSPVASRPFWDDGSALTTQDIKDLSQGKDKFGIFVKICLSLRESISPYAISEAYRKHGAITVRGHSTYGITVVDGVVSVQITTTRRIGSLLVARHAWAANDNYIQYGWIVESKDGAYHSNYASVGEAIQDAVRAFARRAEDKITKKEREALVSPTDRCHILHLSDSYESGNCEVGTAEFAEKIGLGGRSIAPLQYIEEMANKYNNDAAKRAVSQALYNINS